jgi:DNA repair protein RadA/Sms
MDGTAVVGEVGLTGEVRAVGQIETRAAEMKKMGFTRCLVPRNNLERMAIVKGFELIGVKNISEAMEVLFV